MAVVRRTALIQLVQVIFLFWKMHAFQTRPQSRKTLGFENLIGQRIINVLFKITQGGGDDMPQLAACDSGNLFVNGNITAKIERGRLNGLFYWCFALSGSPFGQKLEFRIEKHELRFLTTDIDKAEQDTC